jgi:predicted acyl esterase
MDSSKYRIGSIPVLEIDANPPTDPGAGYGGLNPRTRVLPVGYKREPDCRAWETKTVFEQDIPIRLRDGIIIRADVFRPAKTSMVPAIVHYSPYGKSGTG